APSACEAAGVPNVSYNGSTKAAGPNTYIISSRINWAPYYEYAIKAVAAGTAIDTDYVGTIATGSVELAELNEDVAAEGTAAKIEEVKAALEAGTLHVFDTATFTVDGEALTSYKADVDSDAAYTPDTEVISDGYFHESEYRSAPYFDLVIDGIEAPVEG
ncbi:MAG: BMP family ABC transporter substrate-binding protein, partial [Clostridia bacterium]|nr:BMP family ABC transporter substrate-binding protein [Clostridia bacterium]